MRAHTVRPYDCSSLFIALFIHFTCSLRNAEGGVPYRSLPLKTYEGAHCAPLRLFILIHCVFFAFYMFIVERRGRRSLQIAAAEKNKGAHCAPLRLFILIHCVFFAFYVFIVERRERRSLQIVAAENI